jgi:hypothetical protein
MFVDEMDLAAVGRAAADLFRRKPYNAVPFERIAESVTVPARRRGRPPKVEKSGRSLMWLYTVVQSKGQAVALGAATAWAAHLELSAPAEPPQPTTIAQAREAVRDALTRVLEFEQQEAFLFEQLAAGLCDLPHRRNATPRSWPDSPLGRVAAAAQRGACGVFTDHLAIVLRPAMEVATWAPAAELVAAAAVLSDLAFRTARYEPTTRPRTLAAGISGYWLERHLLGDGDGHGSRRLREVDDAERLVAAAGAPDLRWQAQTQLARAVLATGRAHRRAVAEYETALAGQTAHVDWEAACDTASRLGLANLRWGDLPAAEAAQQQSRQIAADHLGPDDARIPRADTLLAEIACAAGRPATGLLLAEQATASRSAIHARSGDLAAWRRLSLSQAARVLALARSGQAAAAVAAAQELLTDREQRLGEDLGPSGTAPDGLIEAHQLLAVALLEQGRLAEAKEEFTRTLAARRARGEEAHANSQRAIADLSRCLLLLGRPEDALLLLNNAPGRSSWFAERVSRRLAVSLERYYAEALLAGGEEGNITRARIVLRECTIRLSDADDPLHYALARSTARALQADRQLDAAIDTLLDAEERQATVAEAGDPSFAALRCQLGDLLVRRGRPEDLESAGARYDAVLAIDPTQLDSVHPRRLAAWCGRAEIAMRIDAGALGGPGGPGDWAALPLDAKHPVRRRLSALLDPSRSTAPTSDDELLTWDE